jgi:Carboxypeptidase regulatory-like domain
MAPSNKLTVAPYRGVFCFLSVLALVGIVTFNSQPAFAQVYSGSLTGIVSDATGAVIPAAKVDLVDVNKGYSFTGVSDAVGRYLIRNLPPSTYKLTVEAKGFEVFSRTDISLAVNENATADVVLRVGAMTQQVEVRGSAALLATQDSTTGQDISRTYINDLPLVGRSVYDLTFLAPGINPAPGQAFGTPMIGNNFTSNGGRNATADFLLDGVSTSNYEQNTGILTPLYTPSVDAVQEYKVEQNNFSADKGFSGNTVVNVVMRSGTNRLHGSGYEFVRNSVFDANNWFNNRNGIALPALRYNDFGGTIGGPIQKNKMFFFADYEGSRTRTLSTFAAGVPSMAERNGDFGELCAYNGGTFDSNGACSSGDGQLWDPYSGVYNAADGGPDRSVMIPFNNLATFQSAGNPNLNGTGFQLPAVPGNLIDPTAQKMLSFYPLPNVGVGTGDYNPFNNWAGSGRNTGANDQFDLRIDRQFSQGALLTTKFFLGHNTYHGANCFGNALDPCTQGPGVGGPWGGAVNYTRNFGPKTVLTVSYGFTRSWSDTEGIGKDFPNFDPVTDLGLPSYMGRSGIPASPVVYIYGGYQQVSGESLGAQAWSVLHYALETHDLLASLDRMQGRHELKLGGEMRMHRDNFLQPGAPEGVFTYDFNTTSQYPWSGGGDAMASFITGVGGPGQWGEYEIPLAVSTQNFEYSGYFQDNWRATDKLSVNLGIRYDVVLPRTERYNRMEWFNPSVTSPLQVPGSPTLKGGLQFPTASNRYPVNTDWNDWQPRLGLAYRIGAKTVLRAGYGIFYSANQFGAAGTGPGGFDGFLQTTNWIDTYQNDGATPGWDWTCSGRCAR